MEIGLPFTSATIMLFGGDRWHVCDEVVVATENGRTVGCCSLSEKGEDGRGPGIVGIWVSPEMRRRGVGMAIFMAAINRARKRGWKRIHVDVLSTSMNRLVESMPRSVLKMLDVKDHHSMAMDLILNT